MNQIGFVRYKSQKQSTAPLLSCHQQLTLKICSVLGTGAMLVFNKSSAKVLVKGLSPHPWQVPCASFMQAPCLNTPGFLLNQKEVVKIRTVLSVSKLLCVRWQEKAGFKTPSSFLSIPLSLLNTQYGKNTHFYFSAGDMHLMPLTSPGFCSSSTGKGLIVQFVQGGGGGATVASDLIHAQSNTKEWPTSKWCLDTVKRCMRVNKLKLNPKQTRGVLKSGDGEKGCSRQDCSSL